MNYYIFKKEDNDFSEMLSDKTLKPLFNFKIKFKDHLILGSYDDVNEKLSSYITLKYGDMMVSKNNVFINRTPKAGIDYSITNEQKRLVEKIKRMAK